MIAETTTNVEVTPDLFKKIDDRIREIKQEAAMSFWNEALNLDKIREAVLICSPKTKDVINNIIPELYVVASPFCPKDKCYMVTDKELANDLKRTVIE